MQSIPRTARLWLGSGAALLTVALVFHGPPNPDLTVQLHHVADGSSRWALVHWTAAVALFLFSGAAFLTLLSSTTDDAVARHPGPWMVMALGALTTITTAVTEASVVSVAAHMGDQDAFNTWWAFSSGMANGFFALAIAVGLIALAEFSSDNRHLPQWAAAVGAVAGFLSALGWCLGEQLGIAIGGPIWLVSTLVMCLWLVAFSLLGPPVATVTRPTAG